MSKTYIYTFFLCTATLYAFNSALPDPSGFAKEASPHFVIEPMQERTSLGSMPKGSVKLHRKILFKNSPFKFHLDRRIKALEEPQTIVFKPRRVSVKQKKKQYIESARYQYDDLVIGIKSELFRLGCYRGKINTVWGSDVREEVASLNRGLSSRKATNTTLSYLKRQKSLGCVGTRVWDQLVFKKGKNSWVTTASAEHQSAEDIPFETSRKNKKPFSKRAADKKMAQVLLRKKRKKKRSRRRKRRVAKQQSILGGILDVFAM